MICKDLYYHEKSFSQDFFKILKNYVEDDILFSNISIILQIYFHKNNYDYDKLHNFLFYSKCLIIKFFYYFFVHTSIESILLTPPAQ